MSFNYSVYLVKWDKFVEICPALSVTFDEMEEYEEFEDVSHMLSDCSAKMGGEIIGAWEQPLTGTAALFASAMKLVFWDSSSGTAQTLDAAPDDDEVYVQFTMNPSTVKRVALALSSLNQDQIQAIMGGPEAVRHWVEHVCDWVEIFKLAKSRELGVAVFAM